MYLSHSLSQSLFNMETQTFAIYVSLTWTLTTFCLIWNLIHLSFMYISHCLYQLLFNMQTLTFVLLCIFHTVYAKCLFNMDTLAFAIYVSLM